MKCSIEAKTTLRKWNLGYSWLMVLLLATAVFACISAALAGISHIIAFLGPETRSTYIMAIHELQLAVLLCAALAATAPFVLNQTVLHPLRQLRTNAFKRAAGESASEMMPPNPLSDIDQAYAEIVAQRDAARLREEAIADFAFEVICSLAEDLVFENVAPTCLTVWGIDSESLRGSSLMQLVLKRDREKTGEFFVSAREKESHTVEFENRLVHGDGRTRWMHWEVEWSQTSQCFFAIIRDITPRKELERLREQFFAMVSHDIRTPLASVQIYSSLLDRGGYGELNDKGKRMVSSIHEDITIVNSLISELLDFQVVGSTEFRVNPVPTNPAVIVHDAIRTLRPTADAKLVSIEVHMADDLQVLADAARLRQVIVNLLSNAIKYSSENGTIEIKGEPSGEWCEISFRDSGTGVPVEMQESIFEPFAQVDSARDRQRGGTGLGLAIAKQIIQAHGGQIGVRSTGIQGSGSTFWFTVKLIQGCA